METYIIFFSLSFLIFFMYYFPHTNYIEEKQTDIHYIIRENVITREVAIKNINNPDIIETEKKQLVNFLVENNNKDDVDILTENENLEELIKLSLEKGSLEIIKKIDEKFDLRDKKDDLQKYIGDNLNLKPEINILRWSCLHGNTNIVEWIIEKYNITEKDIREDKGICFSSAASSGNLELLKMLKKKFNLNYGDAEADKFACLYNCIFYNNLDCLKWIIREFGIKRSDIFEDDCENFITCCGCGYFEMIKWLTYEYKITKDEATRRNYSAMKGLVDKVKGKEMFVWFCNTFEIDGKDIRKTLNSLLPRCNIEVMVHIFTKYGIKENDISYDCIEMCIREDKDDILSFIHSKICNISKFIKLNDNYLFKEARQLESKKCIEFIIKNFHVLK